MPGDPTLIDVTYRHITAITDLLAGHPLYVTEVTGDDATREYPYWVLHPQPGDITHGDLGYSVAEVAFRWQITAVGRDVRETVAALNAASAQLVAARPTVVGRGAGLISQEPGTQAVYPDPAVRDPNTQRPVFYAVAQFELHTWPA